MWEMGLLGWKCGKWDYWGKKCGKWDFHFYVGLCVSLLFCIMSSALLQGNLHEIAHLMERNSMYLHGLHHNVSIWILIIRFGIFRNR